MLVWRSRFVAVLIVFALPGSDSVYRSASVDRTGRLHLILDSGEEILPERMRGQTSFGGPVISPDRRTVGWLAMCPDPATAYAGELAGHLVIYRDKRVLHTFDTGQTFWDWGFRNGGKQVAYSTGPTHGGAAQCVLRDVVSGRLVARWRVTQEEEPPDWARSLRQ